MSWHQIPTTREESGQQKPVLSKLRRISNKTGTNVKLPTVTDRKCLRIPAQYLLPLLLVLLTVVFVPMRETTLDLNPQTSALVARTWVIGEETAQSSTSQQVPDKDTNDKYYFDFVDNDKSELKEQLNILYEYEQSVTVQSVKGRLKKHLDYWKKIEANSYVLDIIENGYAIPFITTPDSVFSKNNKSAIDNAEFVSQAIAELLVNDCIEEVKTRPHVINPLTVSTQKSGKKRLILDLREVNKHIWKNKIKFEDWRVALQYFEKNSFNFKFDLRSGYHHLDIAKSCQTYLGFSWEEKFYIFTVLPFGLSSSPYVFTKCLRPLVKFWRKNGIRIVLYLDDGMGTNSDFDSAYLDSVFVSQTLFNAGFVVNIEKSIWKPCQEIVWLGLIWNSLNHSIQVPSQRLVDLITCINRVMDSLPFVSARILAGVTGRVISMSPVIGNVTRLMTRNL